MPLKRETKNVRHTFTAAETAELNQQYRRAVNQIAIVQSDFESVKKQYKAKESEAEARVATLDGLLDAGFQIQEQDCVVVYRVADKEKDYYLLEAVADGGKELVKDAKPVATEKMMGDDFQIELLAAEAQFEARKDIALFAPTDKDVGLLIIGRQGGKWYTAIRASVAGRSISERLDGEAKGVKNRPDAVRVAVKRFGEWLTTTLGKESAQGFEDGLREIVVANEELAE